MNDALDDFVRALKEQGFLVVEKRDKDVRLILVGLGKRAKHSSD